MSAPTFVQHMRKAVVPDPLPRPGEEDYSFLPVAELREKLGTSLGFEAKLSLIDGAGIEAEDPLQNSDGKESWKRISSLESDSPAAFAMKASKPVLLRVPAKVTANTSLVLSGNGNAASFCLLEAGASAKITLRTEIAPDGFLNAVLVFQLEPGATLELNQEDFNSGAQAVKLRFLLAKNSKVKLMSASAGNRLQRLAVEADLLGSGADFDMRGAVVLNGSRRCHRHVLVRHRAPGCRSRQLFKTVVLGSGRSSVDGTVVVEKDAQQTDARQLIRHLVLSKEARADAKPRLLIHANDVKCAHGASTGKLDSEQAFYLRSRGLSHTAANRLLTQAFLAEAFQDGFENSPALPALISAMAAA